jgi:opacity protein-like surface antigen
VLGLKPNAAGIVNFTPYVFAGVGYSFIKVKRDYSRFNASHFGSTSEVVSGLDEDIAVAPPRGIPVVPIGLGVRYGISPKLSFTLESSYRHTFTDYLDGFSRAANPALKDSYHSHTAGLIFSFGNKNKLDCPPVKL